MPVTYYSESEYTNLENKYMEEKHILISYLKQARGESCNMLNHPSMSCSDCEFHYYSNDGIQCNSRFKYLPK